MIKLTRPACPNPGALTAHNYKHPANKDALRASTHGKCMYCESKINHIDFADVEHIKPKAEGKFPELEFDWSNLGYSCGKCNNEKREKYFTETPFLDPYSEDPSEHLVAWGSFLEHRNGSERGEITIREIALNRPELLERRDQRLQSIGKAIDACHRTESPALKQAALSELSQEARPDKEYSMFVAAFLNAHGQ